MYHGTTKVGNFKSWRLSHIANFSQLAVEDRGLQRRGDTQFRGQHLAVLFVLADHGDRIAGCGVQAHQQAVAGLVQRIQRQAAPGVGQGLVVAMAGEQRAGQPLSLFELIRTKEKQKSWQPLKRRLEAAIRYDLTATRN